MTQCNTVRVTRTAEGTFVLIDADTRIELTMKVDKAGIQWFPLPTNAAGWKSLRLSTLEANNYDVVLEEREQRVIAKPANRKQLIDYLSEDDRKVYEALIAKAEAARQAERDERNRPLTPVEKLQRKIAREQAQLASLLGNNDEDEE